MNLAKKLCAALTAALMVVSLGALAGCADNSEQIIRDALNQELEGYKNVDSTTLASIDEQLGATGLSSIGISNEMLAKSMLNGFDYKIDSVKVDGDTAEAIVSITCKDFSNMESKVSEVIENIMSDTDAIQSMSMEQITSLYGDKIMEALNSIPVRTVDPITVKYKRNGNVWEPTSDSSAQFSQIFLG